MNKAILYGFLCALTVACQSTRVAIDYDTSTDFSRFHSYALEFIHINEDALMQERLQSSVIKHITLIGLQEASKQLPANIIIRPSIQSRQRNQEPGSRGAIGFGGGSSHSLFGISLSIPLGSDTMVNDIDVTIDMLNHKTQQLIWRGTQHLAADIDTPEVTNKLVDRAIKSILSQYPPLAKGQRE